METKLCLRTEGIGFALKKVDLFILKPRLFKIGLKKRCIQRIKIIQKPSVKSNSDYLKC